MINPKTIFKLYFASFYVLSKVNILFFFFVVEVSKKDVEDNSSVFILGMFCR